MFRPSDLFLVEFLSYHLSMLSPRLTPSDDFLEHDANDNEYKDQDNQSSDTETPS